MFGYRSDGHPIPEYVDPIVKFTPYIMTTRNDAQNFVTYPLEYKPMADYIRSRRDSGESISFMTILIAAYVRAVRKYPVLNRFVVGKHLYEHADIAVSYIILREMPDGRYDEAAIKMHFSPDDTLNTVAKKINEQVRLAREPGNENSAVRLANVFLKIPLLPGLLVWILKMMDKFGLLPKSLIEASPFHCSLFVTNMMSINMPGIYHHLYNFGTCSLFASMGRPERVVTANKEGKASRQLMIPLSIVSDERVCGGAEYAQAMHAGLKYMMNPEALETLDD
ncbi:MAG: 2-oxo acid dehydrogenase subunit E2 [Clostridiales bacterium]|nr:2-oxo acid dehydrogenase subunit E2 [Clostridiales bacterium]